MNKRTPPPYVSVVMAVYNGERHLYETISSILSQTFTDFEFLIINDGSTDSTAELLAGMTDPRIIVLHNDQNQGLPYSLNKGLARACGQYIARIDVGDLAVPERLKKQVSFLERHPEVGIIGTGYSRIDENGQELGIKRNPSSDLEIRWMSLLKNPFFHPTVMLRKDVLDRHNLAYDPTFHTSQDYELWTRLLEHTQGANLDELLVLYRKTDDSITATQREQQFTNHDRVVWRTFQRELPGLALSQEDAIRLREVFVGNLRPARAVKKERAGLAALYLDLLRAFCRKYSTHPNLTPLRRQETLRIALIAFRVPYISVWLAVLKRVFHLAPGAILPLAEYVIKKHVIKRGQRLFGKMRTS